MGEKSATASEPSVFYYHPDHLGSTAIVSDVDGRITQNVVYIPFGEVFVEQRDGNWNTPYLFNAKELDEETGLYYYGARYLDPTAAQWLSVDPLFEKYAGMSPYNYCAGNPVKLVDVDGDDITIAGVNNSYIVLATDLIDISVNIESLGIDWGGQYTLQGEEVLSAGLDIVGLFDPSGVADGLNASLQAKNGDWGGALLSGIGIIPYIGDAGKIFKIGDDYRIISKAIAQVQKNRIIGKIAESQITKKLLERFGDEAQIGKQITARFEDGSKIVFDNVVVKNGKIVYIGETKSGKATLSAQQKRFFENGESVKFVGDKADMIKIKGEKVDKSSVETKVERVTVEEL